MRPDNPVRSERSGSKRWSTVVGLLLLGLVVGGFVGGLIGGILGTHRANEAAAAVECYFAGCGYFLGYVLVGVLLGAILGAISGGLVGVILTRKPTPPK